MEAATVAAAVYGSGAVMVLDAPSLLSPPMFTAALILIVMSSLGLYQVNLRTGVLGIVLRTAIAFVAAVVVVVFVYLVLPLGRPSPHSAAIAGFCAFVAVVALHTAFFALADAGLLRRRVLVIGDDSNVRALLDLRRRADRRGFEIVGCVPVGEHGLVWAGEPCTLMTLATEMEAQEIVIGITERRTILPVEELVACRYAGIRVTEMMDFIEREAGKIRIDLLRKGWLVYGNCAGRGARFCKRFMDLAGATLLLILTLPVMAATAMAVVLEDGAGAPLLYRQVRVGLGGRPFTVTKFRSMRVDAEADGRPRFAAPKDARLTRVGRIIRKLRIDELPQLFNVIQGEMSLIGPRPERPEFVKELALSVPFYQERHRIKPGITGWAQMLYPYGSSRADAVEKLQYDLYYLKNHSLLLDVVILLQTVEVVVFGKGAR